MLLCDRMLKQNPQVWMQQTQGLHHQMKEHQLTYRCVGCSRQGRQGQSAELFLLHSMTESAAGLCAAPAKLNEPLRASDLSDIARVLAQLLHDPCDRLFVSWRSHRQACRTR